MTRLPRMPWRAEAMNTGDCEVGKVGVALLFVHFLMVAEKISMSSHKRNRLTLLVFTAFCWLSWQAEINLAQEN